MYDWQLIETNMQKFSAGHAVVLNPTWRGYEYLKKEFGSLFPRYVKSVDGDVVHLHKGQTSIAFASQTLTRV